MYLDPNLDRAALASAHRTHDRQYGWTPQFPMLYLRLAWRCGFEPAAPDSSSAETIWEWHRKLEVAQ